MGSPEVRKATPWWDAGRKPAVQWIEPPAGRPRGSGSTTKAGRSWLSEPSPYDSQAPRLGKPFIVKPVFIWNAAGVWLELLAITACRNVRSCAHVDRCGNCSL